MHFLAVSRWLSSTDGDRCLRLVAETLLPHTSVYDFSFLHVMSSTDIITTGLRLPRYLNRLSYQPAGMASRVLEIAPNGGLFESDDGSGERAEPRKR